MAAQTNNLLRKEARERAGIVRDPEYTIDLDLTTGDETFGCVTTVNFRADAGAATFIDYTAPEVTAATLNGRQLPKDAFNGDRIALEGLEAENELVVEGASAYVNTGAGLHRFADPVDNEVYLHSQFEPFDAHRVYPCFDQPDIKGTFEFTVKAPQGWRVVGNTLQIAGDPSGEALLWRFPVTKKMSTYITAIVAGPFEILRDNHNGIDLGLLCRKSMLKYLMPDSEELFEITKQSFDFFEKLFDYPYVFGKYDQLFVPEFNAGAMENAGCVTFNEAFVFRSRVTQAVRERRASVITHEMSHMWFGDLVTMRWWDDLWLNESFASYQQTLALAEATRFTDAWTRFAQGTKAFAYMQDQLPTTHPITADIPDTEATHSNFDGITYSKGASVLKQLVAWVGRDAFDEGLRRYFKRYEYGNTELSDFLSCLEETSGRDLAQWSKQWLETAGVNTFSASFEEEDGAFTSFDLIQDAHPDWPTLRSHRIAIGLYEDRDGKLAAADRIEMDASGKRTEVKDLIGKKMPDLIVINDADLTYAKVRLDDRSLATLVNRLKDIDDSLARALCWAATWEMVRDAEMAARDYLKMVTNNIGTETDIGVVQTLLGQTFAAITTYGDPDNRSVALQTLAAWALDGMKTADPGSDLQRALAESFISAAEGEDQLKACEEILSGTRTYEGLSVDIDLRWRIVETLASAGRAGDQLIDEEVRRDPTDAGERYAVTCRGARPSPAAKEEIWDMFTVRPDVPVATLRSAVGGFHRIDQHELLRPYAGRYFEAVRNIWDTREHEVARVFATGMFPKMVIGDDVVATAQEYLATQDPPYPLRRILLEAQDSMKRAVRARSKDREAALS